MLGVEASLTSIGSFVKDVHSGLRLRTQQANDSVAERMLIDGTTTVVKCFSSCFPGHFMKSFEV